MRKKSKPAAVREPIQVYLDRDDRSLLDRLAKENGISRAEVLRRGLKSYAVGPGQRSPMLEFIQSLKDENVDAPTDMAERHDDYLAEEYLDNHEGSA